MYAELVIKKTTTQRERDFGRVFAFANTHKEQGQRTLHLHWQICVEDVSPQMHEDLWNSDQNIQN